MTETELPNLASLHEAWQLKLNATIAEGTPHANAAQSMLTVAVTAVAQSDGIREAARQLAVVAGFLSRLADREEGSGAALH